MDQDIQQRAKDIVRQHLEACDYDVKNLYSGATADFLVKDKHDGKFYAAVTAQETIHIGKHYTPGFVFDTKYISDLKEVWYSTLPVKIFVVDFDSKTVYWETLKNLQIATRADEIPFPLTVGALVYYAAEQFTGRCFLKTPRYSNCGTGNNDALKRLAVKIAMKTLTKSAAYTSPSFTANIFDFYTNTNLYVVKPQVAEFIGEERVPCYRLDESEFEFLKSFQARTNSIITIVFVDASFGEFAFADLEFLKRCKKIDGFDFPMTTQPADDKLRIRWHKNYFGVGNIPSRDLDELRKFYAGDQS